MKRFLVFAPMLTCFAFLLSCSAPTIDPLSLQMLPEDQQRVIIPDACKNQYQNKIFRVAVVPFLNNTTYGDMTAKNIQEQGRVLQRRKEVGVGGVVGGSGAAGFGYAGASRTNTKYSRDINIFMRQIAPKIGEFAQSAVEDTIVNIGGVEVFSRSQMQNVLNEQNFQMNLADQNTIVQFGKIAGVDYIIAGSVDNIRAVYIPRTEMEDTDNDFLNFTQALVKSMTEGWNITTEMTVQLIDVTTGQVIVSKKVKGRELGGIQPGFNPELIIAAAKKAMSESVADLRPVFSDKFVAKAYINQLRGGKSAALISMGKNDGLKPGDKIVAYELMEIKDFMSGDVYCSKVKIPVEMIVSDQIDQESAWVIIKGDKKAKARLKVGTLVSRAPLQGQNFLIKLY